MKMASTAIQPNKRKKEQKNSELVKCNSRSLFWGKKLAYRIHPLPAPTPAQSSGIALHTTMHVRADHDI